MWQLTAYVHDSWQPYPPAVGVWFPGIMPMWKGVGGGWGRTTSEMTRRTCKVQLFGFVCLFPHPRHKRIKNLNTCKLNRLWVLNNNSRSSQVLTALMILPIFHPKKKGGAGWTWGKISDHVTTCVSSAYPSIKLKAHCWTPHWIVSQI